jgi:type II secretory pathway predicted ATPase ExeA
MEGEALGVISAATEGTYSHFGLSQPAFGPITEPGQIFRPRLAEPVLKEILAGSPVLAVRGGRGVGKTIFMHLLARELALHKVRAAIAGGAATTPAELQALVAQAGGLDAGAAEPEQMLRALWGAGVKRLVLLCDDADAISAETFRYLALLLKLRYSQPVRIQVVLLGAAGPWAGLGHPHLDQLRAATESYVTLSLRSGEAEAYLDHRLSYAGQPLRRVMTPSAALALQEEAHGNPRLLDELAEQALVHGSRTGRRRLTARSVREALMARGAKADGHGHGRRAAIGAAAALFVVAACGAVWLYHGGAPVPEMVPMAGAPRIPANGAEVAVAARRAPPAPVLAKPEMRAPVADLRVATAPVSARGLQAVPQHVGDIGPGLVLVAGAHDDMQTLYRRVYKGVTPPPYDAVLAANPMPVRPGALVIFPAPPDGWTQAVRISR